MDAEELRQAARQALKEGRPSGAAQFYKLAEERARCHARKREFAVLRRWAEDIARFVRRFERGG